MKKKLVGLAISLLGMGLALASFGCEQPHSHTFANNWTTDESNHWRVATCGHGEEVVDLGVHDYNADYKCITCGYRHEHTYNEQYVCFVCSHRHEHTYASEWSTNDSMHWRAATCGHEEVTKDSALHTYGDDRICTVCEMYVPTEGLKYTLSSNGDYYSVLKGEAIDSEIFIPSTHEGLPVTAIETNGFFEATGITAVHIPNSVTVIGDSAFRKCTLLSDIKIPTSVTMLGKYAFAECPAITSFIIPSSVKTIEEYVFYGSRNIKELIVPFVGRAVNEQTYNHLGYWFAGNSYLHNKWAVPSSLKKVTVTTGTNIWNTSFYECKNLEEVTVPSTVTKLGRYAFQGCDKLTTLNLPASIVSIGVGAFQDCIALTDIRFGGTVEKWNSLNKGVNWDGNTGAYVITCSNGKITKPVQETTPAA